MGVVPRRTGLPNAADWAEEQVARVEDDPAGRRALADRTYAGPTGDAPDHLPFRRAELAFLDWQLRRGVLEPATSATPGSPWWRACNGRLLRDGCEASARSGGRAGPSSSAAVDRWVEFIARPSAATWYLAHNASIVGGYLDHRAVADAENECERFFFNVVLVRVLFAHAMVAEPRLALGWLAPLAPALGDPRVRMTGLFLSLSRVLPDAYPLDDDLSAYLTGERRLARFLDYAVIAPRLEPIYAWSAAILNEPRLNELLEDGCPTYAWPIRRAVWNPAHLPLTVRLGRRLLPATRR